MSSNNSSKKYCGPQLVRKTSIVTTQCYNEAAFKVWLSIKGNKEYPPIKFQNFMWEVRKHKHKYNSLHLSSDPLPNIDMLSEKIDEIYLLNLTKLSSKMISDILWVHERGKILRKDRTIDVLTSELIHRELFNSKPKTDRKKNKNSTVKSKSRRKDESKV
jgi:hypothetical protein